MLYNLNKYIAPLLLQDTTLEKNLTIMFWINMTDSRNTRELLIGTNPFNFAIILEKSLSNQISFYCGDGSKIDGKHAKYKAYTGRLPYNELQHVCFTRNSNEIKVYINSTLKRTYTFNMNDLNLETDDIWIGHTCLYYLTNLTQVMKFLKIYNNSLTNIDLNRIVNYNNFSYYYEDKFSKIVNIFNVTTLNYRFSYDNYTYIYNDNLFIKSNTNYYNNIVKFNGVTLDNTITKIETDDDLLINDNLLNNDNIHAIIDNIISWQFGMYQEEYEKNIPDNVDGFWSKRECNFYKKYVGKANSYSGTDGDIKYNYGSLQDGTGVYIKLLIDYYLNHKDNLTQLIDDCLEAINKFVVYLNRMIYDNGGIPQYFPLQGYHFDNICLNDGAFMNYLRCCDFVLSSNIKNELHSDEISKLENNHNKALNCILDLQVTINGIKTIWAQQYNPDTLLPTHARSFEIASLCSLESAQLLIYLMSLSNPSTRIKESIQAGCEWFMEHSIKNYIQELDSDGDISIKMSSNTDRYLYARYYTLTGQIPVFFDREGDVYTLETFNKLPIERRNGYTWLGCWGDYLLEIYDYWKTINL